MRKWNRLSWILRISFLSADPCRVLTELIGKGVVLEEVVFHDPLHVSISVAKNQWKSTERILNSTGCKYQITDNGGVVWLLSQVLKRPVLVAGAMVMLFLTLWLPGRILFVSVEGNERIAEARILEAAEAVGLRFGCKARQVRSEKAKNALLYAIPELQWVGINISGCNAVISVKEESDTDLKGPQKIAPANIVAASDGVVQEMTVYRGTPLCTVGQTVKAGDILVSGITDSGIMVRAEQAEAEIIAHTLRRITGISVPPASVRGAIRDKKCCWRVKIGKNLINLCNHSGFQDTTCVKMYSEEYWTLPGGLQLPISVIKEERYYFTEETSAAFMDIYGWMETAVEDYLHEEMIAGEILTRSLSWEITDETVTLSLICSCREMIGQVKYEEFLENHAEDN